MAKSTRQRPPKSPAAAALKRGREDMASRCRALVCREHLAQPHEGPHDGNIDLDRAVTVKHTRQHRHALLRKHIRSSSQAHLGVRIGDHSL